MTDVKKDHSLGAGSGAVAGALTGAAVGAVAGPLGSLAGAAIGGVVGAKAGDSLAEMVNPTVYTSTFERSYTSKPYYSAARSWDDYAPAYQYAYDSKSRYAGRKFGEVEGDLERNWSQAKGTSRLAWNEAKEAVRDGWHSIEHAMPGDADGDGR